MTKLILDNWSDRYEMLVVFANTGLEHPKTLEFVHNCDQQFGFNTVWVEGVVHRGERKASTHKVVTFETASRKGEPFEACIEKYGIPNSAFPQCTRELKLYPIRSYLRSLGINYRHIPTAIGIRNDEKRRVSKSADVDSIIYPLVTDWPTDKQDVLDWWEDQPFNLEIDEFEGNCLGCYKKSLKKHFMQIERDPSVYDFHRRMEDQWRSFGPQKGDRVFFRGNTDTRKLFKLYEEYGHDPRRANEMAYENGGCSESCEIYETEEASGVRRAAVQKYRAREV
jgi:hypothetical protein